MHNPENNAIACDIFKGVAKIAREQQTKYQEIEIIQEIIQNGIDREALRDEIYVQCMRQLTNNPNEEQVYRLWLLLCHIVGSFPPSQSLSKVQSSMVFIDALLRKIVSLISVFCDLP